MGIGRLLGHAFRHPGQTLVLLNRDNLRMFFKSVHHSGLRAAVGTTIRVMDNYSKDLARLNEIDMYTSHLDEVPADLELPVSENPIVSIIIPVYNQYRFTMACLESIIKNSGNVDYEVIIGDDRSTDETTDILKHVRNLVVIRNEKNLGFLLNCNHASECARGKYLLFLNNDTVVCDGWLEPLVRLIRSDERIGAVGSKLVYPDGLLQEAGGIIWSDGTAMNYGKGDNPNLPQYNYVKEVDYVTGASLMVRRDLFRSIGGFDPLYAPAYCEDSDLCIRIRDLGYSVLYQPLSKVVHFEGMTHGKDAKVRSNPHQERNVIKLESKWKDYLSKESCRPETDIFHARDRSQHRKTILMLSHYIPSEDMDSENRPVYLLMRSLCRMRYSVKLYATGINYDPNYAVPLEQMGVELLFETPDSDDFKTMVRKHRNDYDHIILNGYSCAANFERYVSRHSKAKVHYLVNKNLQTALEREYDLTQDQHVLMELALYKKKNPALLKKAESVITLCGVDTDWAKDYADMRNVHRIPMVSTDPCDAASGSESDLLFVGFLGTRFNQDAVRWMVDEVMPLLRTRILGVRLHVVGGMAPESMRGWMPDDIIMEGHLDNDGIHELYRKCTMFVNPMRISSGFRCTAADAMSNGMPIVSTSAGKEGFDDLDISTFDDAKGFAEEIIRISRDSEYRLSMSAKVSKYIRNRHSSEEYRAILKEIFG